MMASLSDEMNDVQHSLKLFIVLTRALDAIQRRVKENIQDLGLNPTEFAVLELIYSKGEQPIQKIGEKILIASSSTTYVVDKLENKNFIKRQPCPEDRRITYAVITETGQELMDDVFPKHQLAIQDIFSALTIEEKALMIEKLKKLGYHAENM